MNSQPNVNVLSKESNNVNVNVIKNPTERRIVVYIMRRLGTKSIKDFAYWRKVAQKLSEAQIAEGLEIAIAKKSSSEARIRYVTGVFQNMMSTAQS